MKWIAILAILSLFLVGIISAQTENEHVVSAIAWNRFDSSLIAVGYRDGNIEIIDVTNSEVQATLQIDTRPIRALQWSHDGNLLASSSYSGQTTTIGIWNMLSLQSTPLIIELEDRPVTSLAFNSANDEVITVDTYYGLRVWDVQTGLPLVNPSPPGLSIMAMHLPSNQLATASSAPIFLRWDLSTGYRSVEISQMSENGIPAIDQEVSALAWNQAGTRVATGQRNGVLRIWDVSISPIYEIEELLANDTAVIDWDMSAVRDVTFLNNDAEVATISANGTVRSWDLTTIPPQILLDYDIGQSITAAEFSPDGTLIAYGTTDESTLIIDFICPSTDSCF